MNCPWKLQTDFPSILVNAKTMFYIPLKITQIQFCGSDSKLETEIKIRPLVHTGNRLTQNGTLSLRFCCKYLYVFKVFFIFIFRLLSSDKTHMMNFRLFSRVKKTAACWLGPEYHHWLLTGPWTITTDWVLEYHHWLGFGLSPLTGPWNIPTDWPLGLSPLTGSWNITTDWVLDYHN